MALKIWVLDGVHRMNGVDGARRPAAARDSTRQPRLRTAGARRAGRARQRAPHASRRCRAPSTSAPTRRWSARSATSSSTSSPATCACTSRSPSATASCSPSIDVECATADEARQLLQRFMREFKPEQVKRYLAREVIGGLPNASAIDLSQFAGLSTPTPTRRRGRGRGRRYGELLAALRTDADRDGAARIEVSVVGRWSSSTPTSRTAAQSPRAVAAAPCPRTPLAGPALRVRHRGRRRPAPCRAARPSCRAAATSSARARAATSASTARTPAGGMPRSGSTTARGGSADAGSTNGIRVESGRRALQRGAATPATVGRAAGAARRRRCASSSRRAPRGRRAIPVAVAARRRGSAVDALTPIAAASGTPRTPLTPILRRGRARPGDADAQIAARAWRSATCTHASSCARDAAAVSRRPLAQPDAGGRLGHEGVSGHHVDIVELDDGGGSMVVVHGDNGVPSPA